jgi:hypothetical protein
MVGRAESIEKRLDDKDMITGLKIEAAIEKLRNDLKK